MILNILKFSISLLNLLDIIFTFSIIILNIAVIDFFYIFLNDDDIIISGFSYGNETRVSLIFFIYIFILY